jgi:hypothetical protein
MMDWNKNKVSSLNSIFGQTEFKRHLIIHEVRINTDFFGNMKLLITIKFTMRHNIEEQDEFYISIYYKQEKRGKWNQVLIVQISINGTSHGRQLLNYLAYTFEF